MVFKKIYNTNYVPKSNIDSTEVSLSFRQKKIFSESGRN